jgi:tetratricopeptide (TPR) repeat protein
MGGGRTRPAARARHQPDNADAHRAYAHLLSNSGRHAEAIDEARRARELDPLSLITNALEGQFLFYAGQLDASEARYRKTLELEPDYWVAHNGLGRVFLGRGHLDEAVSTFETATALSHGSVEPLTQLGYALGRAGRRGEARRVLDDLRAMAGDRYVPAYAFAIIHHGLGDRAEALNYLEQSLQAREVHLTFVGIDTRWDSLRADPRFSAVAAHLNLE